MKKSRIRKMLLLIGTQAMLFASSGSCLPDNILAETAGEIVSGIIIGGFNNLAADSGIQV